MNLNSLRGTAAITVLGALGAAVPAQVIPTLPYARTFDVFVGERGLENVLRLRDLDQNGDYDGPGESLTFFTSSTLMAPTPSGIALNAQTGIVVGPDGSVYAVDSTGDQIVRMRDLDGDGDADDAGEATMWFSSAGTASGVQLGAAQSLAIDHLGRLFVLTANQGASMVGFDGVLMLHDHDADGNAQGATEATYWCLIPNAGGGVGHSNPTEFAIGPDGAIYYADIGNNGPIAKGIYKLQDLNFDGDANDAGEVVLWWTPQFTSTVPAWFGMAFDPFGRIFVTNQGSNDRSIQHAFDLDASGAIDPGEFQIAWSSTASITFWDLVRRDDGTFLALDGAANQVLAFVDLDMDGDFLDPGETSVVFDCATAGFSGADPRTLAIMRAPQLDMAPTPVAIGNPVTWWMQTSEPFDLAVALGAGSIVTPIPLAPWGNLEIDPSSLILFGLAISDISGQATFTLNLANDPALIGAYGAQAWCGELSRMFLSNPAQLIITP